MNETDNLKVFISNRDSACDECHEQLGRQAWIFLAGERGTLCLACADLDHLAFLPSGDAALTPRAKKRSRLYAIVLKWSRTRKRYERDVRNQYLHEVGDLMHELLGTRGRNLVQVLDGIQKGDVVARPVGGGSRLRDGQGVSPR